MSAIESPRSVNTESLYRITVEQDACSVYKKWCKVSSWACLSLGSLVGTVASTLVFKNITLLRRIGNTCLPFGFGFSLNALLQQFASRSVLEYLKVEACRLGIPLYFLLTQLYLNAESVEEQQWLMNTMMTLWGFQVSSVVHSYAKHNFQDVIETETEPLKPLKGSFTLITDATVTVRRVKLVGLACLGGTFVGSSFYIPDSVSAQLVRSFGTFLITESITIPLWERVEIWGSAKEYEFNQAYLEDTDLEPSKTLKAWRVTQKCSEFLSLPIAGCFFSPGTLTLGIAGVLHGISDEHQRFIFMNATSAKADCARRRIFPEPRCVRVSWKVVRVAGETFGLVTFGYLVFIQKNQVDNLMIGSFLASTAFGWLTAIFIDRVFHEQTSSPLMQTLFFRTFKSPEILGIDPLYLYYYTVYKNILIGSGSLSSISAGQALIDAVAWGAYGFRAGQDMAAGESSRETVQNSVSRWLFFSNMLAMIEEIQGNVN